MGSPPPDTSKNVDPKLRSVSNIVIPPARTGKEIINIKDVIITLHANMDNRSKVKINLLPRKQVEIKLILPAIEETPAKCKEKIIKSTEWLGCPNQEDKGGYRVHPVPAPVPINIDDINNNMAGGSNQNPKLFNRGNDISSVPTMVGRSQFPNPPIKIGITMKKIIATA